MWTATSRCLRWTMLAAYAAVASAAMHVAVGADDGGGGAMFSAQRVITTAADRARSVYAADLDGDGDADVLSAPRDDDKVAGHENRGGAPNPSGPDLVVDRFSVWPSGPLVPELLTLSARVRAQADGSDASATMLRYYRSADATISASDTQLATDGVSALGARRSALGARATRRPW